MGKGVVPLSYLDAFSTAIPKKFSLTQRLLTIFTALYSLEAKAIFANMRSWLRTHSGTV